MMWLCYPNNPMTVKPTADFYAKVVAFARKHRVIVVSDEAYVEVYYGAEPPLAPRAPRRRRGNPEVKAISA